MSPEPALFQLCSLQRKLFPTFVSGAWIFGVFSSIELPQLRAVRFFRQSYYQLCCCSKSETVLQSGGKDESMYFRRQALRAK